MGFLTRILGLESKANYAALLEEGAIVIDVRTDSEFRSGHFKGSKNIPLNKIEQKVSKLKALNKPIILCCRSGARSGQAKRFLEGKGVDQVYNIGGWHKLNNL